MKEPKVYNSPHFLAIVEQLAKRRQAQRRLFVEGKITIDLSSIVADDHRKLRRLMQCLGNVGGILEVREGRSFEFQRDQLKSELERLAANAIGWLEALEAQQLDQSRGRKS
jgi:hypothetical protein